MIVEVITPTVSSFAFIPHIMIREKTRSNFLDSHTLAVVQLFHTAIIFRQISKYYHCNDHRLEPEAHKVSENT